MDKQGGPSHWAQASRGRRQRAGRRAQEKQSRGAPEDRASRTSQRVHPEDLADPDSESGVGSEMLHPNEPTADAIALGPRTPQGEARLKVTLRLWLVFGSGKPSEFE